MLRVPRIVRIPGFERALHKTPVSLIDLFPTLVEYLGIENLHPRPGKSLLPMMKGENVAAEPIFFSVDYLPFASTIGMRKGDLKLVYNIKDDYYQLFNLSEDPQELRNLFDKDSAASRDMIQELGAWFDANNNLSLMEAKLKTVKGRMIKLPDKIVGDPKLIRPHPGRL